MTALLYFFALVALWVSAKAVVYATEELARFVSIPPFILSFVLLGIMTSTPEIGLLVNASVANADEIYVGNLMGGIFTLFGLIIPLLVILRHKLSVQVEVKSGIMAEILLLLSYPIVTTLDGKLYWYEGVLCILSYVALVVYFLKKQHLFLKVNSKGFVQNKMLILVTLIGVGLYVLLYASKILVGAILDLSHSMNISPYVFSFLFSPLATNLPEISIIFQSLRSKKVEVALGDYLGSASANVILLGIGIFMSGESVLPLSGSVVQKGLYVAALLGMFYYFSRTNRSLSRTEGVVMLLGYVGFLVTEVVLK